MRRLGLCVFAVFAAGCSVTSTPSTPPPPSQPPSVKPEGVSEFDLPPDGRKTDLVTGWNEPASHLHCVTVNKGSGSAVSTSIWCERVR